MAAKLVDVAEDVQSAPTPRVRIAQAAVVELAERQWGVVKRSQLDEIGLTGGAISRWLDGGRLHRIHPRVYAVGHGCLSLPGRLTAALFYAGPGAALFGVTAAAWLGLIEAGPEPLHVCTRRRRRSLDDVQVHRRRKIKRVLHKRLPVPPTAEVLLQIASEVTFYELRRALSEAEFLKLISLKEVDAALGPGKPGSAAVRTAIECHRPQLAKTKKGLEEAFLLLCERRALPLPDVNVWVQGWLVDAVWFDRKLVVELDSHLAHSAPSRLERDHRRDLELREAGFIVLRYTWQQVTETPERVIADLARHGIAPTA